MDMYLINRKLGKDLSHSLNNINTVEHLRQFVETWEHLLQTNPLTVFDNRL